MLAFAHPTQIVVLPVLQSQLSLSSLSLSGVGCLW